jgi:ubiquinone/menaquinone biosynthesis C-methylase UbiE
MAQSSSDDAADERIGEFSQDLFKGTARCYARYRAPPPRELLDDLLVRARIGEHGRLLDLACGPGRVALPVSPAFAEVWAVDQEPEMIAVGRDEALL